MSKNISTEKPEPAPEAASTCKTVNRRATAAEMRDWLAGFAKLGSLPKRYALTWQEGAFYWGNLLSAVHGESHANTDGTSRQKIIASCSIGEEVRLVPERNNPVDSNAVSVCRVTGGQIGYLPMGGQPSAAMLRRGQAVAVIHNVTGGGFFKRLRGVVILIGYLPADPKQKKAPPKRG
jgi:hypothetical protein